MDLYSIVTATSDQVSTHLEGQVVILNLKSGGYFGLSAVGARIWELLEKPIEIRHIRDTILAEYQIDAERCEKDVLSILENMEQAGLITISHETHATA